jgi:hypothetical protein
MFELKNGDKFHRFTLDGKRNGAGPPAIITNIWNDTPKLGGQLVVIDDVYCGVNFEGGSAGESFALEFNVFGKAVAEADLIDPDHKPDYHESIPIGFNQFGPPEPAKWTQFPYGYAKIGQTMQLCLRDANTTSTSVKPFTVQFRERLIEANV